MTSENEHRWVEQRCQRCGTAREEAWFLDADGRPIMALVWTETDGQMTVRPFAFMRGMRPPRRPTATVDEALPHIPLGAEPPCSPPTIR